MDNLSLCYRNLTSLRSRATNPRTHSDKQIQQLAASIEEFGFVNPVLIDNDNVIVAGHGRAEAAKLLDIKKVPTIRIEDLTPDQIRAYVIADNKLALNAGWDDDLLGIELGYLSDLDIEIDPTITGFEMAEIDILIGDLGAEDEEVDDPADVIPEPEAGPNVTRPGDIWTIGGKHRLICGDATDPVTYARLLDGDKAQIIFTDPPYNVPIDGHVSGLGKVKHREFAMASGEMSSTEFEGFLATVFANLVGASADGSVHFICIDWRHLGEVLTAGAKVYTELKNLCVWAKTNGGMGSLYRSQHELVFVFKNGTAPHINNVELGRHGRSRTNVWTYPGANALGANRQEDLAMHPTVKPVGLVADAILDCSRRRDIVLDAFTGSGTTLIAAARTGRRGYGIEIDPGYCDVTIKRLAKVAGLNAVHAETGRTFDEIRAERAQEPEEAADEQEL